MSETQLSRDDLKTKQLRISIEELKPWEDNPRAIEKVDYNRMIERIKGRQIFPLLVMEDGTVLGGNMRLRGYTELGRKEVWVSIIELQEENGKFVGYVNGERDIYTFSTREEGMLKYAVISNESFGKWMEQELAEYVAEHTIDMEDYNIGVGKFVPISEVVKEFGVGYTVEDAKAEAEELEKEEKDPTSVKCPRCGLKFEPK